MPTVAVCGFKEGIKTYVPVADCESHFVVCDLSYKVKLSSVILQQMCDSCRPV